MRWHNIHLRSASKSLSSTNDRMDRDNLRLSLNTRVQAQDEQDQARFLHAQRDWEESERMQAQDESNKTQELIYDERIEI